LLLYLAEFADAEGKPVDPVLVPEARPATNESAPETETPPPAKPDAHESATEKPDATR